MIKIQYQINQKVMPKYVLLQKIGFGSYSDVYKAKQVNTNKLYAIKIMKEKYQALSKQKQDRQIQMLKRMQNHPCIIKLEQVFINNNHLNMVFELLQTNLIDCYKNIQNQYRRNLTKFQIQLIIYQALLALDGLHAQGIAHRDIKPENILLNVQTGELRLVDFGLAKKINDKHNTNYIATRWYRSPELLLYLPYDLSIDTFALGCVMLQLYLGYEPFQGFDQIDQLNKLFSILGSPTIQNWREGFVKIKQQSIGIPKYNRLNFQTLIPNLNRQDYDILNLMLEINPKLRKNTKELLKHRYFDNILMKLPKNVILYEKNNKSDQRINHSKSIHTFKSQKKIYNIIIKSTKKLSLTTNITNSRISNKYLNNSISQKCCPTNGCQKIFRKQAKSQLIFQVQEYRLN